MNTPQEFDELVLGVASLLREPHAYPPTPNWQRALNHLALRMHSLPLTTSGWLAQLERPVAQWWGDAIPEEFDPASGLLYDGALSEDTVIYLQRLLDDDGVYAAFGASQALALENKPFRSLLRKLRDVAVDDPEGAQREYVLLRAFLVRHPFTTDLEIREAFARCRYVNPIDIGALYGDVLPQDPPLYTCERCGPLSWRRGRLAGEKPEACGDHHPELPHVQLVEWRPRLRRVTPGIHHRVVLPGIPELRLYNHALALVERKGSRLNHVTLWPDLDRFDLRLDFDGGETWRADLKDHRRPEPLARELARLPAGPAVVYVIPERRLDPHGHYLGVLRAAVPSERPVQVMGEDEFIERLEKRARAKRGAS